MRSVVEIDHVITVDTIEREGGKLFITDLNGRRWQLPPKASDLPLTRGVMLHVTARHIVAVELKDVELAAVKAS